MHFYCFFITHKQIHQVLNRKWYGALFKGKYNSYRAVSTIINVALLFAFALTAVCGMSMSGDAVPFLYGMFKVSFARRMHLSMSHWAFLLMGIHLGLHVPAMLNKEKSKKAASVFLALAGGAGLYLFIKQEIYEYMFFQRVFVFMDFEKAGILVFAENLLMLLLWISMGMELALLLKKKSPKLQPILLAGTIVLGIVLLLVFPPDRSSNWNSETNVEEDSDRVLRL